MKQEPIYRRENKITMKIFDKDKGMKGSTVMTFYNPNFVSQTYQATKH